MDSQSNITRRFGPEFVAEYRRRYGRRQPQHRQLTYDIAAGDDYAGWRRWLDEAAGRHSPVAPHIACLHRDPLLDGGLSVPDNAGRGAGLLAFDGGGMTRGS